MNDSHSKVYNDNLQLEIDTLEWLLKQLKPYTKKDITEERIKAIIAAKVEDLERKMKKASYIWDTDTLFTKAETLRWVLYVILAIKNGEILIV